MKKLFLFLMVFFGSVVAIAQVKFTALTIKPDFPTRGSTLQFEYNKKSSPLISEGGVDIVVYQFTEKGLKVFEPVIKKNNDLYSGSVQVDENANLIAFGFSYAEEKDNNKSKGYILPVYNNSRKPVKGFYAMASTLQNGYGEYLFGMANDPEKGLAFLEEGLVAYPELKTDANYAASYFGSLSRVKKDAANAIINAELNKVENNGKLSENDYNLLIQGYTRLKNKEKTEKLKNAMRAAYPDGKWKKTEAGQAFNKEKDPVKKLELYNAYMKNYPPTAEEEMLADNFKSQLASAYADADDFLNYDKWNNQVSKASAASTNNNIAWYMAKDDKDIATAKRLSYDATMFAKNELEKPSQKKPENITQKQWIEERKGNYAMYADTYGYVLYKMGDYQEGLRYAKEAAEHFNLKNAEYNERYGLLAAKVLPAPEAEELLATFVKEGVATTPVKEALKEVYVAVRKSDNGFAQYLEKLEADAKEKRRAEIAKTMINEPSPGFSLKDFDGKTVSLDDMKGKIVVVDFWATWCGPCIASMPGMNKALAKYKGRDDVQFLFIDTWETADNKIDNARKFMEKKKYPFYVLMDSDDKMVSDFKVNGIPTKFILDKNGNIRFKAVGFSGKEDELVDEIDTMIELASK